MDEETRKAVLSTLKHSQAPRKASQIVEDLPGALRMPVRGMAALLNRMAEEEEIFLWPVRRYWHRGPEAEAPRLVQEYLTTSPAATPARIRTALKLPLEIVESALNRLIIEGRAHAWQPGKTRMYALFESKDAARKAILKCLEAGPLEEKELIGHLRTRLPGYNKRFLKEHLQPLLRSGHVREHPRYGRNKARFATTPPEPDAYLERAVRELEAVQKILAAHGISLERIFQALGRRLRVQYGAPALAGEGWDEKAALPGSEHLILEGIARLQPPGQTRALVSIRDLRRSLNLTGKDFDGAVFSLASKGRVALHHHDFPSSLSPSEREEMIHDEHGTCYVGIVPTEEL